MQDHILIIEDEIKIAELLKDYLIHAGYQAILLHSGENAIEQIQKEPPSLIILDIMLPGKDGMEICKEVRNFSNVPIIMLTARVDEIDRIIGLELGADDYVCKPFSPREVVARVKAILRRNTTSQELDIQASNLLKVGKLEIDTESHTAQYHGIPLKLTPNEFKILQTLLSKPNRIFTREELLLHAQGYQFQGYDRTIDTHIKNLRRKLADVEPEKEIISSIYAVGYKLNAEDIEN